MPSYPALLLRVTLPLVALAAGHAVTAKDSAEAVCGSGVAASVATLGILTYTTCAGTQAIVDKDGTKAADLFYTAYFAKAAAGKRRPIAFVWNGGPGADSRLLQFHALGPKTLKGDALTDNASSLLQAADLVFLDPAGTGFSRATSPASAKRLYSTTGDIAATASFIRAFLQAHGRDQSPVYLVGESFGTWRAAGTAEALVDAGQPVAGIALISGGIPMGEERDRALARALTLPNRTATALALGKLNNRLAADPARALNEAETWARTVWHPALADPQGLSDRQRKDVVDGLARYMGLAPSSIDPATLWVSPREFRTKLLAKEGRTLGIFDMRQTGAGVDEKAADSAILKYYRETLGYAQGQYAGIDGPELHVGNEWQYDQSPITPESLARAVAGEGPPSPSQPWVLRALEKAPSLRVFVATGLYDSLNGCAANRQAARDFPVTIRARIKAQCYRGGHMMYEDPAEALQFARDLETFVSNLPGEAEKGF